MPTIFISRIPNSAHPRTKSSDSSRLAVGAAVSSVMPQAPLRKPLIRPSPRPRNRQSRLAGETARAWLGRDLVDLLSIDSLGDADISAILDEGMRWFDFNRQPRRATDALAGLTIVNAFFE